MVLAGASFVDFFSPGVPAEGSGARWMARLLEGLPDRRQERFLMLPSAKAFGFQEVMGLVSVPLGPRRASSIQPGYWESPHIYLPAGEFRLEGGLPEALLLCNGGGCFAKPVRNGGFTTRVALARFHLRTEAAESEVRLRPSRLGSSPITAERSLGLASGVRIHSLDDKAFLERKGFWVRAGAVARFVLEREGDGACRISLANGGRDNWVEVAQEEEAHEFSLRPWETKGLEVHLKEGISTLTVTSSFGFRPSELDPKKSDRRLLGVFLTVPQPR
jgi:hypothetical protein